MCITYVCGSSNIQDGCARPELKIINHLLRKLNGHTDNCKSEIYEQLNIPSCSI
jgi:hypothetical protein